MVRIGAGNPLGNRKIGQTDDPGRSDGRRSFGGDLGPLDTAFIAGINSSLSAAKRKALGLDRWDTSSPCSTS